MPWSTPVVPIGYVMIQSLPCAPWLLRHYDPVSPGAAPCGSELASASIIDGPGQAGAIADRPANDHWMNSPSSVRIQLTIRLWCLHLCRSIHLRQTALFFSSFGSKEASEVGRQCDLIEIAELPCFPLEHRTAVRVASTARPHHHPRNAVETQNFDPQKIRDLEVRAAIPKSMTAHQRSSAREHRSVPP